MHHMPNGEDYLSHKGILIKPIEEHKRNETSPRLSTVEQLKVEQEIEDKQWRSCCFSLHKESSLFFAKIAISVSVIMLCSYQLVNLRDCNYQSLYSSLLSSVITFWLSKNK